MIEIQKNYKLTLTEQQAKELYELLRFAKDGSYLTHDKELMLVYHQLQNLFASGIR
jgi:hypothetical protein